MHFLFFKGSRADLAEQCKAAAKEKAENGSGDAPEATKNGDAAAKLTQDNTAEVSNSLI